MEVKTKKLVRFDWAMKYILRNKANFDVLEAFLTNLLKEQITILELLESESNQEAEERKFNRVDLKCKDSQGRQIIIEIQNQRESDYLQRLLWGTSKAVVESLDLGESYQQVVKVISISILYHTLRKSEEENTDFIYHGYTNLIGMHTKQPLVLYEMDKQLKSNQMVTSELVFPEYYLIYVEKFEDLINEELDEWIYFFKHGKICEDFKSPGIILAGKKLDLLTMSEQQRKAYDEYLAYLGQELGILENARAEGRKEGRKERDIEVAKNLLILGMDEEVILKATSLRIEELNKLQQELKN